MRGNESLTGEEQFNCRVNFYLLNRIWKWEYGHRKSVTDLYDLLNIDKNWYSRIQKGGITERRTLNNKWNNNIKILGDSLKDYMLGKKMVECSAGGKRIEKRDWEDLFDYIDDEGGARKEAKRVRWADINSDLEKVMRIRKSDLNTPIGKMYYFCKNLRSVDDDPLTYSRILDLERELSGLRASDWKKAPVEVQKHVRDLLSKQYEIVDTIIKYDNLA